LLALHHHTIAEKGWQRDFGLDRQRTLYDKQKEEKSFHFYLIIDLDWQNYKK
jgi:hypothetical protein